MCLGGVNMPELDILENVVEGTSHCGTPFFLFNVI